MRDAIASLLVPGVLVIFAVGMPLRAGAQADTTIRFETRIIADSNGTAGDVSGTVLSAHTGAPITSAHVSIRNERDHRTVDTITDRDGSFRVTTRSIGESVLQVLVRGYKREALKIDTREAVAVRIAMKYNPPSIGVCKNPKAGSICQ